MAKFMVDMIFMSTTLTRGDSIVPSLVAAEDPVAVYEG